MTRKEIAIKAIDNTIKDNMRFERAAVRRGLVIFWLLIIAGTALAIWIATL